MSTISQKGAISVVALIVLALFIAGGAYYVSEKDKDPDRVVPPIEAGDGEITRQIETRAGVLTLRFTPTESAEDIPNLAPMGTLTLTGALARGTPCVNWQVTAVATMDYPTSNISIEIKDAAPPGTICIQVIGEPQQIDFSASNVARSANISVTFAGETVFSGRLNSGKNVQYGELSGIVRIGPICPVETDPPQPNCKPTTAQYSQVLITAKSADGEITRSTRPVGDGFYSLTLPTGDYNITVDSPLGIGGTHQTHASTIRANGTTELNIEIDTGIR